MRKLIQVVLLAALLLPVMGITLAGSPGLGTVITWMKASSQSSAPVYRLVQTPSQMLP